MSEPKHITDTLNAIATASNDNRQLVRERIARFRLDRDKGEKPLPVSNQHDDKCASVLDVSATLGHDHHDRRLGRK